MKIKDPSDSTVREFGKGKQREILDQFLASILAAVVPQSFWKPVNLHREIPIWQRAQGSVHSPACGKGMWLVSVCYT